VGLNTLALIQLGNPTLYRVHHVSRFIFGRLRLSKIDRPIFSRFVFGLRIAVTLYDLDTRVHISLSPDVLLIFNDTIASNTVTVFLAIARIHPSLPADIMPVRIEVTANAHTFEQATIRRVVQLLLPSLCLVSQTVRNQ